MEMTTLPLDPPKRIKIIKDRQQKEVDWMNLEVRKITLDFLSTSFVSYFRKKKVLSFIGNEDDLVLECCREGESLCMMLKSIYVSRKGEFELWLF